MKFDELCHLDMGIGQLTELIGDISVCKCVEYIWNMRHSEEKTFGDIRRFDNRDDCVKEKKMI